MIRDVKSGIRQFISRPLFSFLVTLLLAVGIGSNVLIFGFIDTLLLKPLPVRDPGNLWVLESVREKQVMPNQSFSSSRSCASAAISLQVSPPSRNGAESLPTLRGKRTGCD
jgi:hypothetical protein